MFVKEVSSFQPPAEARDSASTKTVSADWARPTTAASRDSPRRGRTRGDIDLLDGSRMKEFQRKRGWGGGSGWRLAVSGWEHQRAKGNRRPDDWLGSHIFRSRVSAIGSQVRVRRCRFGARALIPEPDPVPAPATETCDPRMITGFRSPFGALCLSNRLPLTAET